MTPPSDYRAFRYVNVEGFSVEDKLQPDQFPLQPGNYFGNIAGGSLSHGGSVSADVPFIKAIQIRLNELGFGLIPDGKFGNGTEAAVKSFQTSKGLVADGQVGPKTWEALFTRVVVQPPPPAPAPDPMEPVLSSLARIEAALATLLAKPSVVAQVDPSSLQEILENILESHDVLDPEAIKEAVKQAFREGTE